MKKGFEKKALSVPASAKAKTKYVVYDRFSTYYLDDGDGTLGAIEAKNCTTVDGTLRAGVGFSLYMTVNDEEVSYSVSEPKQYFVKKVYDDGLYQYMGIMTYGGTAYYVDEEELPMKYIKNYMYPMNMYNCVDGDLNDVLLAVGNGGVYRYIDGSEARSDLGKAQASCLCRNRLFVVNENYKLWYSAPLEYLNFDESIDDSGIFYLSPDNGVPVAMQDLQDKVYIFYANEIVELTTAGAARDFKIKNLPYKGGKIIQDSARKFGEVLIFLATDGIYQYDGKTLKRVYEKLKVRPHLYRSACGSAICDGKLLLRYIDAGGSDRTVALYPGGEYGYYTTFMLGLGEYKGQVFCLYKGKLHNIKEGAMIPSGEYRYFRSVAQNFGVKGVKTLKALHFEGTLATQFELYVDGVRKIERGFAKYVDGRASVNIDLRGTEFSILVYVSTGSELWRLTAEVEYV